MKLIANTRIKYLFNKKRYDAKPGEEIEVTEEDGKSLIEQGAAKPLPKAKAPAKAKESAE